MLFRFSHQPDNEAGGPGLEVRQGRVEQDKGRLGEIKAVAQKFQDVTVTVKGKNNSIIISL